MAENSALVCLNTLEMWMAFQATRHLCPAGAAAAKYILLATIPVRVWDEPGFKSGLDFLPAVPNVVEKIARTKPLTSESRPPKLRNLG